MRRSASIGRIGGLSVSVDWSVLVIVLLLSWTLAQNYLPTVAPGAPAAMYWGAGVVAALLLLGSVLGHELAHAFVARHEGVEVDGLTLWMLGGIARLRGEAANARAEFRIAAVGPAVSVAFGAGFAVLALALAALGASKIAIGTAWWLGILNIFLAVFNLLPGAPLDGGRILTAAVWKRNHDRLRAAMIASRTGQILGSLLIVLGLLSAIGGDSVGGLWTMLIGGFLVIMAWSEYASSAAVHLLGDLQAKDVMSSPVETGHADLSVEDFVNAHLLHGRFSSYPIVDSAHALVGLVGLQQIRSLPRERWPVTRIDQIAIPAQRLCVLQPTDPATSIQGSAEAGGRAIVLDRGDLVGIISPSDISRVVRSREVAAHPQKTTSNNPTSRRLAGGWRR